MNKFLLTLVALLGIASFWACHSNDDDQSAQVDQSEKEEVYLGEVVITPLNVSRGIKDFNDTTYKDDVKVQIGFHDFDGDSQLHITTDFDDSMYSCCIDSSETPDFYIEPIDEEAGTYRYLNANKQPLQDCVLAKDPITKDWTVTVVQNYDNSVFPMGFDPAKQTWAQCFKSRMNSPLGTIIRVLAQTMGLEPEYEEIAVLVGVGLSCAIWR